MAGVKSMTAAEVVEWLRSEEGADLVRESLRWLVQELMEAEVVRHEALSDRAGCKTLPRGCRSSPRKLRAARTRNRGGGWEQP